MLMRQRTSPFHPSNLFENTMPSSSRSAMAEENLETHNRSVLGSFTFIGGYNGLLHCDWPWDKTIVQRRWIGLERWDILCLGSSMFQRSVIVSKDTPSNIRKRLVSTFLDNCLPSRKMSRARDSSASGWILIGSVFCCSLLLHVKSSSCNQNQNQTNTNEKWMWRIVWDSARPLIFYFKSVKSFRT